MPKPRPPKPKLSRELLDALLPPPPPITTGAVPAITIHAAPGSTVTVVVGPAHPTPPIATD